MGNFENQMLDAIDILIQQRVSNLQFDKTVRAKISQVSSLAIGEYKVQYQNSLFYAYSTNTEETFEVGDEVYVQIHSGDFRKAPTILGRTKRLGQHYANSIEIEDKFIDIGTSVITSKKSYSFVSYHPGIQSVQLLSDGGVQIDNTGLDLYKEEAIYLKIGANFRTNLSLEQQAGGGNYGLIIECQYYNSALFKSHAEQDNDFTSGSREDKYVYIPYILDVNNMTGQPYRYFSGSDQFAIFPITGKDLKAIKSITVFCKDFSVKKTIQNVYYNAGSLYTNSSFTTPITKNASVLYKDQNSVYWIYNADANIITKAEDVWIKDFHFTFVNELTEEDLQGTTLKIITPYGAYFEQGGSERVLQAQVTLNGKRVDPVKTKINFYWFIKDNSISNGSQKYSRYGGTGWRCLNEKKIIDGQKTFAADQYKKVIKQHECPSRVTWFKCVAVFDQNIIAATTKLYNVNTSRIIEITSTAGTQFDFGIGSTTLTCTGNETSYYWMYSYDGSGLIVDSCNTKSLQNVTIAEAQDYIYYEVTVYNGNTYIGSANITLFNKTDNLNPFNVHINNRSQIFKYDSYGVSPASRTKEEWDQMVIPDLSFDIYTSTGQKIELTDNEKQRMLQIRWIVPQDNTMLIIENTEYETVYAQTGESYQRRVLKNRANLSFSIENRYNTAKSNNDIILQIVYQGYKIMDNTNFTFTKEGEIGSNGTKYIARLVPNDNYVQEVYFVNGQIRSWSYDTDGKYYVNQTYNRTPSLKMQIWDGSDSPIFDGNPYDASRNKNAWSMVSKGRTTNPAYQISVNGVISSAVSIASASFKSGIVQGQYTSQQLSDLARDYYATYPLMQVYGTSYQRAIVTGGFRFCMYQNDGSRSSFGQTPFVFKNILSNGSVDTSINESQIIWTSSWGGNIRDENGNLLTTPTNKIGRGNRVKIDPPGHYPQDGNVNEYITCSYGGTTIYISVHFYMNKYGLDAINGWDGNSIKINSEGDQYILAPQIGAGEKDDQNRFTGITIGKSFNVNGATDPQIGIMGFHRGERSLFLDAKTGYSIFGKASTAQIVIGPQDYGSAPAGAIYSSNYYKYNNGIPSGTTNLGMLINLKLPQIRWGNKNFVVTEAGHLTARGGGSIAGWSITDTQLISPTNDLFLNSGGNIYGRGKNANGSLARHDYLSSTGNGFYLGPDGLSIGSKFYVDNTGLMRIGQGAIAGTGSHWTIYGGQYRNQDGTLSNYSGSNISFGRYGANNSVYIGTDCLTLGSQFYVNNTGLMRVGMGAVKGDSASRYWTINADSKNSYISYGTRGKYNSVYLATNQICLGNIFKVAVGTAADTAAGQIRLGYNAVTGTNTNLWTISTGSSNNSYYSYIGYGTNKFKATASGTTLSIDSGAETSAVYIGTDGIRLGKYAAINRNGYATFKYANIQGKITANSGTIGGWTIGNTNLSSSGVTLNGSNGRITSNNWHIYPDGTAYFSGLILPQGTIDTIVNRAVSQSVPPAVSQAVSNINSATTGASWGVGYNNPMSASAVLAGNAYIAAVHAMIQAHFGNMAQTTVQANVGQNAMNYFGNSMNADQRTQFKNNILAFLPGATGYI